MICLSSSKSAAELTTGIQAEAMAGKSDNSPPCSATQEAIGVLYVLGKLTAIRGVNAIGTTT
ncbi:hypothetical protein D3C76_1739260 [compost metagenome]